MSSAVKPIPAGYNTITPYLTIAGAGDAIAYYQRAFGAQETCRMTCPQTGKVMHAELRIGDSALFLGDEFPECGVQSPLALGSSTVGIHLYVEDADAAYDQAVAAGARGTMPPTDMFWGDRFAQVVDPFGHRWSIATHIEDVPPEQMQERMAAAFAPTN